MPVILILNISALFFKALLSEIMVYWIAILCVFSFSFLQAQPLKVNVKSKSAILINPDNGAILFEKNAHEPRFPASIMKIATALFVLHAKKVDLKAYALASKKALEIIPADIKQAEIDKYPSYLIEHDGTTMGLVPGEKYDFETLLYGLMLSSANDAANVIAENCSHSIENFMNEFNNYIKKMGFTNTFFKNPHGLFHPDQITTAYEMAKMTALALKIPELEKILLSRSYEWKKKKKGISVIKINNLMFKEGRFYYPKVVAAKTGYTADSGYNMISIAEDKGRRLIVVVIGGGTRDIRYDDTIKLFEEAFQEKSISRVLFSKDCDSFSKQIPRAKQAIQGYVKKDVILPYFPSEEPELKAEILWENLSCPVKQNTLVGYLKISDIQGHVLMQEPIFSKHDVKKKSLFQIVEFMHRHLAFLILVNVFLLGIPYILRMQRRK